MRQEGPNHQKIRRFHGRGPPKCTEALDFKQFFETKSYPRYGIGHLNIMRGAGSLGKPTSLQGKLCYSQGGLIIEEQQAQQQVRLNFLETLRCPRYYC